SRLGRSGIKVGKKAPDFTLPAVTGAQVALHDFAGQRVLLVFTQIGCGPCRQIMPELNRLANGNLQVLVVNNGDPDATRKWAADVQISVPVLMQERFSLSKRYEIYATPFAFLIDEKGMVASKGITSNKQFIAYVLSGRRDGTNHEHGETEQTAAEEGTSGISQTGSNLKEERHD